MRVIAIHHVSLWPGCSLSFFLSNPVFNQPPIYHRSPPPSVRPSIRLFSESSVFTCESVVGF